METLLVAARQPLFIAVLVVALLAGIFVELWLLPLGLIVYGACVVLAARDSSLATRIRHQQKRQRITSTTFSARFEDIQRSRDAVLKALRRTGGPVEAQLRPTIEPQTQELVDQAYTLVLKGQDIETYLAQIDLPELQRQINQVDQRIGRTTDQYTIGQLQGTRDALVKQQENAQILTTYIGRIISQLDNIDANLDAMPAQLLRIKATDVDASMASSQVARNLSDLNADMHAFVNVLDSALDQTRAASP